MSWKAQRAIAFAAMQAEWGVMVSTADGRSAIGIKSPDAQMRTIQPTNYLVDIVATFDLMRADFQYLGLAPREQFICEGTTWEIQRVSDDSADATVGFSATKLKAGPIPSTAYLLTPSGGIIYQPDGISPYIVP